MAGSFKPQTELRWSSQQDCDVRDILLAWERARRARATRAMAAAAQTHGERRVLDRNAIGMDGYVDAQWNADSFHYWGQRLGYDCWNDAQFKREYRRDNDYCRVKNHARKLTVAVPVQISNRRERKVYAAKEVAR